MRGNSNRLLRLAFDASAGAYDAGRPIFGTELVRDLVARAGLHPGDVVLEVGAGTGQLTGGLLDEGLTVIAVEPGANMAAHLRAKFADRSALTVEQTFLEDVDHPDGSFSAVLSANAFHWVDPAVSYHKAARLLQEGGSLGLIWTFPILADRDLQDTVNNDAFVGDLADFRREPVGYVEEVQRLLAEGRAELIGSGAFEEPHWTMQTEPLVWSVADYVAFLCSMANGVTVAEEIKERVGDALAGVEELEVANHVYLEVAAKSVVAPRSLGG